MPSINAECAHCKAPLSVRNDGTYPFIARPEKGKLVFCSYAHQEAWLALKRCAHCDAGEDTTLLTVHRTEKDSRRAVYYCDVAHLVAAGDVAKPRLVSG